MKTESQNRAISNYLKGGGKLTGLEALQKFGTMRLPARVHDLKVLGLDIVDEWVVRNSKRVKQYYLAKTTAQ